MTPPAPPRFSITTGWPRLSCSAGVKLRAVMSVPPPGAAGTISRIGRVGYCASACPLKRCARSKAKVTASTCAMYPPWEFQSSVSANTRRSDATHSHEGFTSRRIRPRARLHRRRRGRAEEAARRKQGPQRRSPALARPHRRDRLGQGPAAAHAPHSAAPRRRDRPAQPQGPPDGELRPTGRGDLSRGRPAAEGGEDRRRLSRRQVDHALGREPRRRRRDLDRCGYSQGAVMTIKLNHTIVHSKDPRAAANFLAELFGLGKPVPFGPFLDVEVGNEVTLAFLDAEDMEIQMQHYAFLVSEPEFDQIFGRIKERGLKYWADPGQKQEGKINRHYGGRGVYFEDPSGHLLEIITKPYGSELP